MAKKQSLWTRGDRFAAKYAEPARRAAVQHGIDALHEYIRFAYMKGYATRQRDERRKSRSE